MLGSDIVSPDLCRMRRGPPATGEARAGGAGGGAQEVSGDVQRRGGGGRRVLADGDRVADGGEARGSRDLRSVRWLPRLARRAGTRGAEEGSKCEVRLF